MTWICIRSHDIHTPAEIHPRPQGREEHSGPLALVIIVLYLSYIILARLMYIK